MTAPVRYGRLPAQIPAGLRELPYYAAGPLPRPAAAAVIPATDWDGPLGNLQYGDCGVAGLEHGFIAAAAMTGETGTAATAEQAVSYYFTYTHGKDTGVILSQYLAYVREHGYYGHSVDAYAPVAVQDIPALQFTIWAYGFAYCGITVTQAMEQAFQDGQPWTPDMLNSPVAGGHCVPIAGYDANCLYAVTWGGVQEITYPMWHYIAEEAWAVLTGEITAKGGDGHGLNLDALRADLSRLAA